MGGAGAGANTRPLEHYKHWAGVVLIGSSLAPCSAEEEARLLGLGSR